MVFDDIANSHDDEEGRLQGAALLMIISRSQRNVLIGLLSLFAAGLIYVGFGGRGFDLQMTLATGYVSFALLAITFSLGPYYYLTARRSPASTYLRRDVSVWASIYAGVHVVVGLQAHLKGRMWAYFIYENWRTRMVPIRHDLFGAANYTGAAATLIMAVLLAISNDASLRRLGIERWRGIQQWGRPFALLMLAHTAAYQLIEHRSAPVVIPVWGISAAVLALYVLRENARRAA